jgi:hypothetical protein
MDTVRFSELSKDQQQAFADFLIKEMLRHYEDIDDITKDLRVIKDDYQIEPRTIYIRKRIEVGL